MVDCSSQFVFESYALVVMGFAPLSVTVHVTPVAKMLQSNALLIGLSVQFTPPQPLTRGTCVGVAPVCPIPEKAAILATK